MFMKNKTEKIGSKILIVLFFTITIGTMFAEGVVAETKKYTHTQWDFEYTGTSQTFIAPSDGNYKVQLWGAEGGTPSDELMLGGRGAYLEGYLRLKKGEELTLNVGGHPGKSSTAGFNGGGEGGVSALQPPTFGGGGGGATDIRKNGVSLQDRIAVSAGGGGGGVMHFITSSSNAVRVNASRGGAGGRGQGQSSGARISGVSIGMDAPFTDSQNYVNGGGSQSRGGIAYIGEEHNGLLGQGGHGAVIDTRKNEVQSAYGGGGGGGYFGGSGGWYYNYETATVGGGGYFGGSGGWYYNYETATVGGGGSSFIGSLEGKTFWANGWEVQPNKRGGTQVGNEGHGHLKISKSNDPPVLSLTEYAKPDEIYHSDDTIRYSGTIKDIDDLGGRMTLYSEVIEGSGNNTIIHKKEQGMFNHSKVEQHFSADVYLPIYLNAKQARIIKFWAEDSEGLRSEVFTSNIFITAPKDIKINVDPETSGWVKGSYRVRLEIKSVNDIKNITTSSGRLNVTNTTNKKEQEGYIIVSENKPVTVRVVDSRNNIEEKTFYVNNIQDLEITNLTDSSFNYKIDNWGDEQGVVEKDTQWEIRNTSSEIESHTGKFSRKAENLRPNENIDVRYKLFNELGMKLATGWTNFETIYTLAEHPVNANINRVEKDRVLFNFNPSNENVNKPRYIFKAIEIPKENGSELSIQNSQIVSEGEEVLIRNLKAETTYTLESATINGNEKQSSFKRMKDAQGNEVRFNTRGSLELDIRNLEDWNDATLEGTIKYNNETPLGVYIHIGSERIRISDDMLKGSNSEVSFNINIKKGNKMITAKQTSNMVDAIKTYEVTTLQGDGQYDVYIETVVNKFSEEYQVGWFGLDSRGPESKSKAIFKRITKGQGILTLDKDNIRDISTPNHQITIDYGQGRMPLFSNKLITYIEPMSIKLYDKLNNVSNLDWTFDTDGSYEEGEDNNEIDPSEEKTPVNVDDSTVEIEVPSGGTHMQTSLDGVTWSAWEERKERVIVSLPTGDGMKSVFVRTGVESYKETPVYNVETSTIEMIKQKGGEISALNNTRVYKYIMDLTAPKLNIRTMDNSLIAINGNITILVDIVDNLDKTPEMTVEVFERDSSGNLKSDSLISKTAKIGEGKTTGTVPLSGLKESKKGDGKLQPYTLKVTAKDTHGNTAVEHLNFYVKNKN